MRQLSARGNDAKEYAGKRMMNVKCDPMRAEFLREEYKGVFPGFYMNKRNWIAVDLDAGLPDDLLRELCEASYQLVFSKLTKKLQREILSLI